MQLYATNIRPQHKCCEPNSFLNLIYSNVHFLVMLKRIFSEEDQLEFASLSGDFNPLHIDSLAARRILSGGLVVHGIHLLLWALEGWFLIHPVRTAINSLEATFKKPVLVGEQVEIHFSESSDTSCVFRLTVAASEVANFVITFQDAHIESEFLTSIPERIPCAILNASELPHCSGSLPLHFPSLFFNSLFPATGQSIPATQLASLLSTTRLVGVKCPGLNSLFYQLNLTLLSSTKETFLKYRATRFDDRFNLLIMSIVSPGLQGTVKAFLRPGEIQQPSCSFIRDRVNSSCFSGQRSLVVGGSRGLGEVISKVLAMGGAEVMITYHVGQCDSEAVVADIIKNGGSACSKRLDVTSIDSSEDISDWNPTHLYYMATPHIFAGSRNSFSCTLFSKFCTYYVEGFAKVLDCVNGTNFLGVFYPSSIALDELPLDMLEYISAKSAGEAYFEMSAKAYPKVKFIMTRLPRLATDQTSSLMPVTNQDPLPAVLSLLSNFENSSINASK